MKVPLTGSVCSTVFDRPETMETVLLMMLVTKALSVVWSTSMLNGVLPTGTVARMLPALSRTLRWTHQTCFDDEDCPVDQLIAR